jgi:hypothetical protein
MNPVLRKIVPITCSVLLVCNQAIYAQQKIGGMNFSPNALLIEQTEIEAWRSLMDAPADSLKLANGMRHREIGGGMAINFRKMPIPLFNRVIGLGLSEPLTQRVIDTIKMFFSEHEKYLVHFSSPMQPAHADSLLKQNGFYLAGAWERIVRDNSALPPDTSSEKFEVRVVDESLRESWVKFLIDTYEFDFYWWPRSFARQNGWKHYVALKDGKIVACRSFFMTKEKTIFSGVDAPVPGVMTSAYAPDFAIWRKAIQDGLDDGAVLFVADIELPDKERNKPAFEGFKKLGFMIPYTRFHYRLNR